MSSNKMIMLKSSDGESFVLKESAARQSQTLTCLIEDDCADTEIPMPNVTGKILALVIEYCNKHDVVVVDGDVVVNGESSSSSSDDDALKKWDTDFVDTEQSTLFELILAANYLNIKSLLDLTCQTVANMIKDKTPEEIRFMFNIENDFTPEEEAQIRRENKWAFE